MEPLGEMTIHDKYQLVRSQVDDLAGKEGRSVRLVAVSKTKSVKEIQEAYDAGARVFGQNYINELEEKHHQLPQDIQWHFIGHLQSNKIKKLLSLGRQVEFGTAKSEKKSKYLRVSKDVGLIIQSGINRNEALDLISHIQKNCTALKFKGLMTIGKEGDASAFLELRELRQQIGKKLLIPQQEIEISMGMSADFLKAIQCGSTNVRVGSSIFGPRSYPKKV